MKAPPVTREKGPIEVANGEAEILKLKGTDRADYVHAMRQLRAWNERAHLILR